MTDRQTDRQTDKTDCLTPLRMRARGNYTQETSCPIWSLLSTLQNSWWIVNVARKRAFNCTNGDGVCLHTKVCPHQSFQSSQSQWKVNCRKKHKLSNVIVTLTCDPIPHPHDVMYTACHTARTYPSSIAGSL